MKITFTTKTSFPPNANTGNRYLQLTKSEVHNNIQFRFVLNLLDIGASTAGSMKA